MKQIFKKSVLITLCLILICFSALPVFAAEFDFDKAEKEFTSSPFNTISLMPGETHTPASAIWTSGPHSACYSSDENVVTVANDGTVTAVGNGSAYVVIMASDTMYELYLYNVGKINTPASNSNINQNDNSVNAFEYLDEVTKEHEEAFENYANKMQESFEEKENEDNSKKQLIGIFAMGGSAVLAFCVFVFFALPIIAAIIYSVVSIILLSKKSMAKRDLPSRKKTQNTITTPAQEATVCPKCQKPFGAATFCGDCGTSKKIKSLYTVPIKKGMTAQKFEKTVNDWLAENPYIYDCKIKLDTKASLLIPFVNFKFFVKHAVIEYSVSQTERPEQYGFAFLYKFRLFGPIGYSQEKQLEEWKKNNPDCTVISSHGGRIQHFGTKSGFYAQYYNYVFFKK